MDPIGVVAVVDGNEVNLYFLEILNGVLEAATKRGQNTVVYSVQEWSPEHLNVTQLCDGRADGLIFIAPMLTLEFSEALQQRHLPFVTIHHAGELPNLFNFDVENEMGAYTMVRHLIDQGHRRVLYLCGEPHNLSALQRIAGYRRALADSGLPFDETLVVPGTYSTGSGRQRMADILDQKRFDPFPTAIFCGNDAIALGAMEVLTEHQIRVPEDVSLAGFDDTLTARITTPQLTTMRQPFRYMGRRAVQVLLPQIDASCNKDDTLEDPMNKLNMPESLEQEEQEEQEEPAFTVSAFANAAQKLSYSEVFDVELVVRGSVGPPSPEPLTFSPRK
jgi:LacI family transcriptional regulator